MLNNLLRTLPYGSDTFEFGIIEDLIYDFATGMKSEKELKEGEQLELSKKFSGYVYVRKFNDNAVVKALYIVPIAGKSMFFCSMPEKGSVCFMCLMNGVRVIIGFVPVPINMMIASRKELDNLVEGEIAMQGSTYSETAKDFFSSASWKIDTYGRFIIESGDDDFRIVVGDLLSNEYTKDVTYLKDSITGEIVTFHESYKSDMYSRSIDRLGNQIYRGVSALWDLQGDWVQRISGRYIISTGEEIRLEHNGSFIELSKDGVTLNSSKNLLVNVLGGYDLSAGSYISLCSFLDLSLGSSASIVIKALKQILMSCAAKMVLKTSMNPETGGKSPIEIEAFDDLSLASTTGDLKAVSKLGNVTIEAMINATLTAKGLVKLGAGSEPVLKGLTTQADLISHMHIGNFGFPTSNASATNPLVFTKILSTKVFTE